MERINAYSWIILAITISLYPPPAHACTCAAEPAIIEAAELAQIVFLGTPSTDIGDRLSSFFYRFRGQGRRLYQFSVAEPLKGKMTSTVNVVTGLGGGDCGLDLVRGTLYLIYAWRDQKTGLLYTDVCSRSNLAGVAVDEIKQLRAKRGKW